MRVRRDEAVAREMLADRGHPPARKPRQSATANCATTFGFAENARSPITALVPKSTSSTGREAEVDAVRAQLARDDVAHAPRLARRGRHVAVPQLTERAHRRYRGEPVAKTLHAPAFVIDADEQRRRRATHGSAPSVRELRRVLVVAREQDDAADERMQRGARDRRASSVSAPTPRTTGPRAMRRASAACAAFRMSAFICRTASRNP